MTGFGHTGIRVPFPRSWTQDERISLRSLPMPTKDDSNAASRLRTRLAEIDSTAAMMALAKAAGPSKR
jgi:hypothetical protein